MTHRLLVLVGFLLVSTPAWAREHHCPAGQVWSLQVRACVKPPPAPKLSPQEKYNQAVAAIESTTKGQPEYGARLLEQACEQKHGQSCTLLGYLYARGRAVKFDTKKAMAYYKQACDLKDLDGCLDIGDLAYTLGDVPQARGAFVHACDLGSGVACARGADLLDTGAGGAKDIDGGKAMFKKAFDVLNKQCPGDGQSCFIIGWMYAHGKGVTQDGQRALKSYRAGCDVGSGDSCKNLALGLDDGSFGITDADGATDAFDSACNSDDAYSCQQYAERMGIANKNIAHAVEEAERACLLDEQYCGTLAEFYRIGLGVEANQEAATQYYETACNAGQATWCARLGQRAHDGVGMAKDENLALLASQASCNKQNGEGCRQLAQYSAASDPASARTYAKDGCDDGDNESCWLASQYATADRNAKLANELAVRGCGDKPVSASACVAAGDAVSDSDPNTAKGYYTKGCAASVTPDSGPACEALVRSDYFGDPKDVDEALLAAAYACSFGRADPCGWVIQLAGEAPGDKTDAKNVLASSCGPGHDSACLGQANLLFLGTDADKRSAVAVLDAACTRGYDAACLRKADALVGGWGVLPQAAKGEEIYAHYCENGNAQACVNMAVQMDHRQQWDQALVFAKRACDGGNADGCTDLGYFYFTAKGTRWDMVEGIKWFEKSCELGSAIGCSNLGYVYRYGIGRPKDAKKAFEVFVKSCTPNEPTGCEGLGHGYETGEGTAKDLKKAEDNYRAACDAPAPGPDACAELAALLESTHKGKPADIARLRQKAFDVATEKAKDNPYSQYVLGTYYRDGMATVKDPAKAREWFGKSCDGYDPLGCISAGRAFGDSSVAGDHERGAAYLQRACAAGIDDACKGGNGGGHGPGTVERKGCGCSGAPDAGGGLLLVVVIGLIVVPMSRGGSSRGRGRASRR